MRVVDGEVMVLQTPLDGLSNQWSLRVTALCTHGVSSVAAHGLLA
jgi:hypothetical protein